MENKINDTVFNDVVSNFVKRRERAKSIVADSEYMLWLEKFTGDHPSFSDDNWLYNPEGISAEDLAKVEELSLFLEGIEEYFSANFYPTYKDEDGNHVLIKFNNVGYNIGIIHGQGSFAYCERATILPEALFIDFNDVMNNKKRENFDFITGKFAELTHLIEYMLFNNIPAEHISSAVKKTISEYSDTH